MLQCMRCYIPCPRCVLLDLEFGFYPQLLWVLEKFDSCWQPCDSIGVEMLAGEVDCVPRLQQRLNQLINFDQIDARDSCATPANHSVR